MAKLFKVDFYSPIEDNGVGVIAHSFVCEGTSIQDVQDRLKQNLNKPESEFNKYDALVTGPFGE